MKKVMLVLIFSFFLAADVFAQGVTKKGSKTDVKPAKKVHFFQLMANWVNGMSSPAAQKISLVLKRA